jgi:hypothetical protein
MLNSALPTDVEARIYFVLVLVLALLVLAFIFGFRRVSARADRFERIADEQARHIQWLTGSPAIRPRPTPTGARRTS